MCSGSSILAQWSNSLCTAKLPPASIIDCWNRLNPINVSTRRCSAVLLKNSTLCKSALTSPEPGWDIHWKINIQIWPNWARTGPMLTAFQGDGTQQQGIRLINVITESNRNKNLHRGVLRQPFQRGYCSNVGTWTNTKQNGARRLSNLKTNKSSTHGGLMTKTHTQTRTQ